MKILIRSLFIAGAFAGATASAQTPAKKEAPPAAEKAPAKAPAQKQELSAADAEKFLAFYNKFVDTVVAAKEDCAKLTKDINALIDANGDMLKKIQEAKNSNKDLPQATKDKMMGRVKEMMPAMQKCQADPGFQNAMKRMESNAKSSSSTTATPPAKTTEPAKTPPAKTTEPAKTPPAKK